MDLIEFERQVAVRANPLGVGRIPVERANRNDISGKESAQVKRNSSNCKQDKTSRKQTKTFK